MLAFDIAKAAIFRDVNMRSSIFMFGTRFRGLQISNYKRKRNTLLLINKNYLQIYNLHPHLLVQVLY